MTEEAKLKKTWHFRSDEVNKKQLESKSNNQATAYLKSKIYMSHPTSFIINNAKGKSKTLLKNNQILSTINKKKQKEQL